MLETIRNRSNGPIAKFIIGLIIVPFAFAGVYSYLNVNTSNAVATVNGEEITLTEFDRSYRLQQQNWGENFDKYFNTDERLQQFRLNVLQQLINQRLSSQAIQDMGLRTSDMQLRKIIMDTVEFQDESGNFDESIYEMRIQSGGYSTSRYQAARKNDLAATQFLEALRESNFILDNELSLNVRLENQTRDIDYLLIPQDFYNKQVNLSDEAGEEAISSYYEMNKSRFSIPEKVSVEYIYLKKKDASSIVISDGQIADYYNDNMSTFESSERRKVAHILVLADTDADQESVAEAELKINNLASRIEAGESFEAVAKEGSEDSSTAESGGDLDWIEEGMMDAAFEDAAFNLVEPNSVSSVIRTDFGFHIIKLLEIESGEAKPLEELKGQITATLQAQFVEDKFFDLKDAVSENAFEISDSLTDVAKTNGLVVETSGLFDRQFGIGLPMALQSQTGVIDAAFSEDVLYQGLNSELVELTDGNAIILRLLEHKEAGTKPLEEVKAQIISLLTQQQGRDATEKVGNEIIASLIAGQAKEDVVSILPEAITAQWQTQMALGRQGTELNTQLRNDVFKIPSPTDTQPVYKGILLSSGEFAIVRLNAVTEGSRELETADSSDSSDRNQKFEDYFTQVELYGYLKYLDANATISRTITNVSQVQ